jgi:hypothetical protein
MRDQPRAVNLAEAIGRAPPHFDCRSVFIRSTAAVEAVAEGYVLANRDAHTSSIAD